jgi:hypothetical protein
LFFDSRTFNDQDLEIIKLEGAVMQFSDTIMHPVAIDIKDSLLFLKNRSTDYIYDIFNLDDNNKKINECFVIGQGPNDFIHPMIVQSKDDNVRIYDQGSGILKEYTVNSLKTDRFPTPITSLKFKDNVLSKIAVLSDNNVLSSVNYNPKIRFKLYSHNGDMLDSIGEYPRVISSNLSDMEKFMNFKNDFTTNFKDRIFICHYFTDLIEVYDCNGNIINRMYGPNQLVPVLEQKNAGGGFVGTSSVRDKTYKCYSSPVPAGEEVFVLYFGELYQDYRERDAKVFVFDWEGNPLRIYELNIPIFTFTIDEKNRILYGISNSPEYQIIKFNY